MPQNVVDADVYTAPVQTAIDGDAITGASRLMEAQDLADRTNWLYIRQQLITSVNAVTQYNGAWPLPVLEAVGAGAWSTAVSFAVPLVGLADGDVIHVCGHAVLDPSAAVGGTPQFCLGDSAGPTQFLGTHRCAAAGSGSTVSFCFNDYYIIPPAGPATMTIAFRDLAGGLNVMDMINMFVHVYRAT